jgi:thiol:disulfide interchange protein DsbA
MAKRKPIKKKTKSNRTLYFLVAAAIIIAAVAFYFYSAPKQVGEYTKLGNPGIYEPGKVKIIEIMKFDCPHCYDLHKELPPLLNKYGDKIEITYIPVVWDGQSTKSIEAYIIAKSMGKGDEMKDAMFESQSLFQKGASNGKDVMESLIALEEIASQVGLGTDFRTKLESGFAKNDALQNLKLMKDYKLKGTPMVIINGNLDVKPTISNMDNVIGSLLS